MILTELYRKDPQDKFEETELYIKSYSVQLARIDRATREYFGETELTVQEGDDAYVYYVKQSPSEIEKMITEEEELEEEKFNIDIDEQ